MPADYECISMLARMVTASPAQTHIEPTRFWELVSNGGDAMIRAVTHILVGNNLISPDQAKGPLLLQITSKKREAYAAAREVFLENR